MSRQQNFKKQQHRSAGVIDALYELAGFDELYWPDHVLDTNAYKSARRLLLAGANAARIGRKLTAAERKAVSFMLGYKVVGPAADSDVVASDAPSPTSSAPGVRPPYGDPAPQHWRQIGGGRGWGCIAGDTVSLYVKQGKEWVNTSTYNGVPKTGCPDWVEEFWGYGLLTGDPTKKSTIRDLYETVCMDDSGEPTADLHPVIAALWRDIIAGIKAAESGAALSEGESTLAFRVAYELTKSEAA